MRAIFLIPSLTLGFLLCCPAAGRCDTPAPITDISPSDPGSIQREIDRSYRQSSHRTVIPAGIYRLTAEPKSGSHLHFAQMKDFEIDATGVTLIFTTRNKGSIDFNHCQNVTLRGATLLRETLPFSQGRITAIGPDGKTADVQVAKEYPADFDDHQFFPEVSLNLYDAQSRQWQDEIGPTKPPGRLGPDSFRYYVGHPFGADGGWKVGAAVAWRGAGAADINVTACQGMRIVGVTIKSGAGFCVSEYGGEGGSYYNYTVTYGPKPTGATEEPILSSNADAFHSNSVRKGPTLEDCHFEGMNDDGIPIHGQYALVEKSDDRQLIVETKRQSFCQPGDHLHLVDERGGVAGEARVVSVEEVADYQPDLPPPHDLRLFQNSTKHRYEKITLDQTANAKFGWLVANADANGAGFVVRRCTVRNHRARGMLIKASDGLIEGCTLEGSSMGGIVIAPEMSFWNEADYSRNLIVRGNTIRNCDYWHQEGTSQAGAMTLAAFEHNHFVPLPGGHRHILVENNTFENNNGTNLVVFSAEDVVIRNNRFLHPMWNPNDRGKARGINPGALIWLTECSGVQIAGNLLSDAGSSLKVRVDRTPAVTGTGFEDGVSIQPIINSK